MGTTLFTSKGAPIQIGRELGKGGEGSVFEIHSLPRQVAKIYHHPPDAKKQAKLTFMASAVDQHLLKHAAWPEETLHQSPRGIVVGFLMSKVTGHDPIHMVYSPAHRRQDRPKAAWDFLICTARNTAAAFEALHRHGHVLGDVNQGNVMVGVDSKVALIDSDSFQVNAQGTVHLCEVGVAHFTPPELQGLSSFQGFIRTANHDNFGLALLIFHLLFGGRHPYSGVPLRASVGESLEADIKGFRYAYARDADFRGIKSPPNSILPSIVPGPMAAMFEMAFTERGVNNGRPTAKQWETALDVIRSSLKKCSAAPMHVFPSHLTQCPWCALERQGVIYFIDLSVTYTETATDFVLAQVWALIEAVPRPPAIIIPTIGNIAVTANPLPSSISGDATIFVARIFVLAIAFAIIYAAPSSLIFVAIATLIGWVWAGSIGSTEKHQERINRKALYEQADSELAAILEQANRQTVPDQFRAKREALKALNDEYENLSKTETSELQRLHLTAQDRQKSKFLERFFIDAADIPGVGLARKATLRSFGIETAADVNRNRILNLKGFGDSLTIAMTDWKASCERKFVFNPSIAATESDKNLVRLKFRKRKYELENMLKNGVTELTRIRQTLVTHVASFQQKIDLATKNIAQTKCDLALLQ